MAGFVLVYQFGEDLFYPETPYCSSFNLAKFSGKNLSAQAVCILNMKKLKTFLNCGLLIHSCA